MFHVNIVTAEKHKNFDLNHSTNVYLNSDNKAIFPFYVFIEF